MTHPKALIFDCDGTLIDSGPLHFQALCNVLHELDIQLDYSWYQLHLGRTFGGMLEQLEVKTGRSLPRQQIIEHSQSEVLQNLDLLEVNAEVVAQARHYRGTLPMAVASNGHRHIVEACLEATGIRELFDTVVSVDDVGNGKPAPDMFLEAARRLGAEPALCLVYEDSNEGLEAARRAGMASVDVRHPGWSTTTTTP